MTPSLISHPLLACKQELGGFGVGFVRQYSRSQPQVKTKDPSRPVHIVSGQLPQLQQFLSSVFADLEK